MATLPSILALPELANIVFGPDNFSLPELLKVLPFVFNVYGPPVCVRSASPPAAEAETDAVSGCKRKRPDYAPEPQQATDTVVVRVPLFYDTFAKILSACPQPASVFRSHARDVGPSICRQLFEALYAFVPQGVQGRGSIFAHYVPSCLPESPEALSVLLTDVIPNEDAIVPSLGNYIGFEIGPDVLRQDIDIASSVVHHYATSIVEAIVDKRRAKRSAGGGDGGRAGGASSSTSGAGVVRTAIEAIYRHLEDFVDEKPIDKIQLLAATISSGSPRLCKQLFACCGSVTRIIRNPVTYRRLIRKLSDRRAVPALQTLLSKIQYIYGAEAVAHCAPEVRDLFPNIHENTELVRALFAADAPLGLGIESPQDIVADCYANNVRISNARLRPFMAIPSDFGFDLFCAILDRNIIDKDAAALAARAIQAGYPNHLREILSKMTPSIATANAILDNVRRGCPFSVPTAAILNAWIYAAADPKEPPFRGAKPLPAPFLLFLRHCKNTAIFDAVAPEAVPDGAQLVTFRHAEAAVWYLQKAIPEEILKLVDPETRASVGDGAGLNAAVAKIDLRRRQKVADAIFDAFQWQPIAEPVLIDLLDAIRLRLNLQNETIPSAAQAIILRRNYTDALNKYVVNFSKAALRAQYSAAFRVFARNADALDFASLLAILAVGCVSTPSERAKDKWDFVRHPEDFKDPRVAEIIVANGRVHRITY